MEKTWEKPRLKPGMLKIKVEGLSADLILDFLKYVKKSYHQLYLSNLIFSGDGSFHLYAEIDPDGKKVGDK